MGILAQDEKKEAPHNTKKGEYVYHKVEKGESVYSIANLYKVDAETIFKLNPGSQDVIWAGATLRLPNVEVEMSEEDAAADTLKIGGRIQEFIEQAKKLPTGTIEDMQDVKDANKALNTLNSKWNVYYTAKQAYIGDNDGLMELVSQYQQICQEAKDSLDAQKNKLEMIANFNKASKFIASQLSVYREYNKQAKALSMAEALASKLEELKAKEQLSFADIEKNYEMAKAAAGLSKALTKPMSQVTDNYVELKSISENVQQAAYKPLFDRIKDYLFGLAAVTIILMFISMAQAKFKSYKAMKEQVKKQKELLKMTNKEYPTI